MTEFNTNLSFPLDDDGFFRRECPLCSKEFKVLLKKEELTDLTQKGIDSFLLEQREETTHSEEGSDSEIKFFCPYCGQLASMDSWSSHEQIAYIGIAVKNITARIVNEGFIHPLKRSFGKPTSGMFSMKFEGKDIKQEEPWISPEVNDLEIFDLPCCHRKIKIVDSWVGKVYCFFCGFPHRY